MVLMPLPPSLHSSSISTVLVHSSTACLPFLHLSTLPTSAKLFSIYPQFLHLPLLFHFSIFSILLSSSMSPLLLHLSFSPLPSLSSPHLSTRPPPGSVSPFYSSLIKSSVYSSAPFIHTIFLPLFSLRVPHSRSSE